MTVEQLAAQLIRIDTTETERPAIDFLEGVLREGGVQPERLALDDERPNLLVRVRGRGEAPPLLLHGHVDVVDVDGQAWARNPFGGEVVDGMVHGRGALDMKGGVAMLVDALLTVARDAVRPPGDLLLALLSNEEDGGTFGARYLVEQHPDRFAGITHALGEFGGFSFELGGRRLYLIQVQEKQRAVVRLTATGNAGHGAVGSKDPAIGRLADALRNLRDRPLPVRITPVAARTIDGMAEAIGGPTGRLLSQLHHPRRAGQLLRLLGTRGASLAPMLRHTATPTVLSAGRAANVIPAQATALLDCRVLPGFSADDLLGDLQSRLPSGVRAEVELFEASAHTDVDWTMYEQLADLLRTADPQGHPVPMLLAGVTDGRHFAQLGIRHVGFLPMRLPPDLALPALIHAADERVPVSALRFGRDILVDLLRAGVRTTPL